MSDSTTTTETEHALNDLIADARQLLDEYTDTVSRAADEHDIDVDELSDTDRDTLQELVGE